MTQYMGEHAEIGEWIGKIKCRMQGKKMSGAVAAGKGAQEHDQSDQHGEGEHEWGVV